MPPIKVPSLFKASFAFSTPSAADCDITAPNVRASRNIALSPSSPADKVFTSAAPSLSNSLKANLSLSLSPLTLPNALDNSIILSSKGILTSLPASRPNSLIAPLASPVPLAASAVLRAKRCIAIFRVVVSTPVRPAAYCSLVRASVVVPILEAVLASWSVAFRDCFARKPNPATPATPTRAVFKLNKLLVKPIKLLPIDAKPFLVLSTANIAILATCAAILLTHYMKVGEPFVHF